MTEINTRETDPAAVRQIAEEIILDRARDVDHSTILEHLADYDDLSEDAADDLANEIRGRIDTAKVTVTFPEASGS